MNPEGDPQDNRARWPIVLASMVGMSAGPSQYAFGSLALFINPLTEEFGWERAQISLASTFFTIALLFSLPVAGRIADSVGTKRLLIPSMLIVGISLAAIPVLVTAPWHLWVIFGVIGCLGAGANALPYMRTVSAWFDRRRGLAIGVTLAGAGLGYTYVPPLLRLTTESYGWRASYIVLACLTCLVAVPLVAFFFREAPSELNMRSAVAASQAAGDDFAISRREAIKTRTFWNLFAVFGLLSFSLYGMMIHSVSMLVDRGMTMENAAYGASLIGITITLSRVVIGYLCDKLFVPRVAAAAFAASTIGLIALAYGATGAAAYFALVLIGFSIGAEIDMMTFLTSRYFGIRHFGEIYGILFASLLIGTSLGPWLFGQSFDTSGSYVSMLWIAAAFTGIATVMCFWLPPYSKTGN
ncbi:MAG: MFS transporter [Woeseiaceae bacterium]